MNDILPQFTPAYFSKFIGLPYGEFDCWELIIYFYKDIFEIDLPPYYRTRPQNNQEINKVIESFKVEYEQIDSPKFGDIILFNVYGIPTHVGVYLFDNKFLHTSKHTDSILEKLDRWKMRIEGYYRVKRD